MIAKTKVLPGKDPNKGAEAGIDKNNVGMVNVSFNQFQIEIGSTE